MNVRNVQKTGNMFYLYLPTHWCKKHTINSNSKVMLTEDNQGLLCISPKLIKKKTQDIEISIKKDNLNAIQKLIMACYINPTNSFKIKLEKNIDFARILEQKKFISLAFIDPYENMISGESNVVIENPMSLLLTMIRKTRNLIYLMTQNLEKDLVERYEEEIDNSKTFIEKSVIASFTYHQTPKLKTIEIHYISLISRDLERLVDHLILLKKSDQDFITKVLPVIDLLKDLMDGLNSSDPNDHFNYGKVMDFVKAIMELGEINLEDKSLYDQNRARAQLFSISEVLMDWAITLKIGEI